MANLEQNRIHSFSPDDPMPERMRGETKPILPERPQAIQKLAGLIDLGSKDVTLGSQNFRMNTKIFREKSTRKK